MSARSAGERISECLPASTATPSCEPCDVKIRKRISLSRSIRSAADCNMFPIDAMVTSPRVFVLARTRTGPVLRRCATMLAAPFASLSNTLCAPNNPKAKTVTFGLAPAGIDAKAKKAAGARSPAATNLMSLLKIMAVLPDRRRSRLPNPVRSDHWSTRVAYPSPGGAESGYKHRQEHQSYGLAPGRFQRGRSGRRAGSGRPLGMRPDDGQGNDAGSSGNGDCYHRA